MRHRLSVNRLTVKYPRSEGHPAVADVNFSMSSSQSVGLVGESGSGKSTLGLAIMGLLHNDTSIEGDVTLDGASVTGRQRSDEAPPRKRIGIIFQDPVSSLNPLMTIGSQIAETMPKVPRRSRREEISSLLEEVGFKDPRRIFSARPHELSGGQCQRAMIAIALAPKPLFLIADEPTTALDVTIQRQILDLLDTIREELGMGLLLITHNLGIVAEYTEHTAVMRSGRMVESGPTRDVLDRPSHAYTQRLLASVIDMNTPRGALTIPSA